jgi:hypothetical protein
MVLPRPSTPQNPTIYITNIVPKEGRAIFESFGESRTAELDMDQYRKSLRNGFRGLAYQRALEHIRPRQEMEYIPDSQQAGCAHVSLDSLLGLYN